MQNIENSHANILRRAAAMVYDGLLSFAVMVAASALFLLVTLMFTGQKGSTEFNPILTVYFILVFFLFFGWLWTHGGQTLGMRAWHIKLVKQNNQAIDWSTALVRYLLSIPMLFFWFCVISVTNNLNNIPVLSESPNWLLYIIAVAWTLFDHLPNNWRDRVSKTKIIDVPK